MYSVTSEAIEVNAVLTEPQFREIGRRLGQPLGRFKGSHSFVFSPENSASADSVCAYLREIGASHDRETISHWEEDEDAQEEREGREEHPHDYGDYSDVQ
jgi:hypothetical protein